MFFNLLKNKYNPIAKGRDMRANFLSVVSPSLKYFQKLFISLVCTPLLCRQASGSQASYGAFRCRNKGFTLIEMMVVISIISIMTVIAISNYNAQRKSKEFSFAAKKLAEDIRKTQNNSVNVLKHGLDDTSGGYGIHLSTSAANEYIIFLDTEPALSKDKKYTDGSDVKIETITFPAGITIGNMNGGSVADADVVFLPPYGKVSVIFDGTEQIGATLEINLTKNAQTKTVKINYEGKIDEQ